MEKEQLALFEDDSTENNESQLKKYAVFKLKSEGYTYFDICKKLKIGLSTAKIWYKNIVAELAESQYQDINAVRLEKIELLRQLVKERIIDLKNCIDIMGDDGKLYRDASRVKSFIIQDIIKLLQEQSRLEGLYLDKNLQPLAEDTRIETLDLSNLDDDELDRTFADLMRNSLTD